MSVTRFRSASSRRGVFFPFSLARLSPITSLFRCTPTPYRAAFLLFPPSRRFVPTQRLAVSELPPFFFFPGQEKSLPPRRPAPRQAVLLAPRLDRLQVLRGRPGEVIGGQLDRRQFQPGADVDEVL